MGGLPHLASAYEVKSILLKQRREDPLTYRLFAFKFFSCVGAHGSVVKIGLDAAQDMLEMRDFKSARTMVRDNVIPLILKANLLGELTSSRSFYAVILAYCRDFEAAHREMASLAPFRSGFTKEQREEYDFQLQLIRDIQTGRVR